MRTYEAISSCPSLDHEDCAAFREEYKHPYGFPSFVNAMNAIVCRRGPAILASVEKEVGDVEGAPTAVKNYMRRLRRRRLNAELLQPTGADCVVRDAPMLPDSLTADSTIRNLEHQPLSTIIEEKPVADLSEGSDPEEQTGSLSESDGGSPDLASGEEDVGAIGGIDKLASLIDTTVSNLNDVLREIREAASLLRKNVQSLIEVEQKADKTRNQLSEKISQEIANLSDLLPTNVLDSMKTNTDRVVRDVPYQRQQIGRINPGTRRRLTID